MRIMIVDDEVIIRTGLCTVIDWKELGLDLLPPAESAEEALGRIPQEKPHIVLTDIRMPGMDGIELSKAIKKLLPETEIVILTGYDDFAYAQQALREGVTDYLLKTSGPEEIIKAAMKAKQNIAGKWETLRQEQVQNAALRSQQLEKLLGGASEDEAALQTVSRWMQEKGVIGGERDTGAGAELHVLLVQAGGWGEGRFAKLLLGAAENMLSELLPCISLLKQDRLLLVLGGGPGFAWRRRLEQSLQRLRDTLKCTVFGALGGPAASLAELHRSCLEAEDIGSYRLLLGEQGLFDMEDIRRRTGGRTVCSQKEESELAAILMSNNLTQLRYYANEIVRSQMDEQTATPASLQAFLQSVVIAGHRWLERARGGGSGGVAQAGTGFALNASSRPEDELFKLLSSLMAAFHESICDSRYSYVHRAVAYIREHLDHHLSLQEVARFVHLNPNHFSEVFKKETGQSYIEFVTQERMRKAADILQSTQLKISEVAGMVGYEDIKYFGQQFKRHTGRTPSEFRQS
ncbi:two-component system, response regulator YesN [Paenibacillus sp. UNCCL117]|uniref:response regulator transcription factor n=1 Tax=unclassified Paenibacillus TaxID=185978 RepID=UPI00088DEF29|nr:MULTISPECIES: response regulator [unclassified Paenibacillus]SDD63127.1 two-component system, response regulator YesN [Paenibacillus sp. cl123]SFW67740.1 two-component system, response regulator YesN [Paenibacillus sp. UNCCL117]